MKKPTATAEELISLIERPIIHLSKDVVRNLSLDDLLESFEFNHKAVIYRGLYTFVFEGFEYKATRAAVLAAARQALVNAMEKR